MAELEPSVVPEGARRIRSTPVFTEASVPAGLLADHRLAEGVWGRLVVIDGPVRLLFEDEPSARGWLGPGEHVDISPGRPHHVELGPGARFRVDFYRP